MKRLFSYQISIIIWFTLFYNVERLINPINIASFVYIYAAALAILILALPALNKRTPNDLFLLALIPFFLLKWILGYQIAGTNLAITITEMTALYVTMILSLLLGRDLTHIRDEIAFLTIGNFKHGVNGFSEGQAEIYREVRRARRYNRPAALLTVVANSESVELAISRFIEEARNGIVRSYINARVAKMLEGQLKDSDVITKTNDTFVILLPETNIEKLPSVINRLKKYALENLGLPLEIGFSTFPDEAVTFSGLLEQAENKMLNSVPTVDTRDSDTAGVVDESNLGLNPARSNLLIKED